MTAMDMKLIKMLSDHYWEKKSTVVDKLSFKGRTFYNKYEKVNAPLNQSVITKHLKGFKLVPVNFFYAISKENL